ncbi:MAG: hypothetical protein WC522_03805 [Candidatus Omnitrophota bacterium]
MPDEERPDNIEESPALQILAQIRDGTLDPKKIPSEIRQDCVEHLWHVEGQPTAAIAQILKVSDKTIRRDKDDIRERNAKKLTPEDRLKLLNEFMSKWTASQENLQRLSRSQTGSIQEKSQAGYFAMKAIKEQIEILQSLGIFYEKPEQSEIDIHAHEEEVNPAKLKEELARLEKIANDKDINDPEVAKLIEDVKRNIAIAEAKEGLTKLEGKINDITKNKDSQK